MVTTVGIERALLSALFSNPDSLNDIDYLQPEHFSIKGNRYIYMAMNSLYEKSIDIDPSSVYHFYTDELILKDINEVGGLDYLFTLSELRTASKSVKLFAERILTAHMAKTVHNFMDEYKEKVMNERLEISEIVEGIEQFQNDMSMKYVVNSEVTHVGDGLLDRVMSIEYSEMDYGTSTGFPLYDQMTLGLVAGELTAFAARAKAGKSTILMNISKHVAINKKKPVLYVDTEMSTKEQEFRVISLVSGLPEVEIKTGLFKKNNENGTAEEKIKKVYDAVKLIRDGGLYHVYLPNFNASKIAALAKKYKRQMNIGLLVFDYIKLPEGSGANQEYIELGKVTSSLKNLAGTLEIPVITAVQLNREAISSDNINEGHIAGSDRISHYLNRLVTLRKVQEEEKALSGGDIALRIALQRSVGIIPPKQIYLKRNGLELIEVEQSASY